MGSGVTFAHHEKDYAEQCRSVLMSFYYFAMPESMNVRVGVEENSNLVVPAGPSVTVAPNPFAPSTEIRIRGIAAPADLQCGVYDVRGRLVLDLTPDYFRRASVRGIETVRLPFTGDGLPAGVYVLKAQDKGRLVSEKMLLVK